MTMPAGPRSVAVLSVSPAAGKVALVMVICAGSDSVTARTVKITRMFFFCMFLYDWCIKIVFRCEVSIQKVSHGGHGAHGEKLLARFRTEDTERTENVKVKSEK